MTDEEFYQLSGLIERSFGVHYPDHKRPILEGKLRSRVRALHLTNFHEYYLRLEANLDGEIDELAVLITNNETYLFRERNHFKALLGEGLGLLRPDLVVPRTLRTLVAGCSSGEEAYTINFHLVDAFEAGSGIRPHVDAFDLDSVRVGMCRRGTYRSRSLRDTSPEQAEKYLAKLDDEHWEIKPPYRRDITFSLGNIIHAPSFRRPLPYDVVFCRNVLIYFSESALRTAISNFASVLRLGGLLFLGHSESIIGVSEHFRTEHVGPSIVYRKVEP